MLYSRYRFPYYNPIVDTTTNVANTANALHGRRIRDPRRPNGIGICTLFVRYLRFMTDKIWARPWNPSEAYLWVNYIVVSSLHPSIGPPTSLDPTNREPDLKPAYHDPWVSIESGFWFFFFFALELSCR